MFLLHINKNKRVISIVYLKRILKKVKNQLIFFKQLKKTKNHKNLRHLLTNELINYKSSNLIKYIIGISIYHTNIIMYISDIKGVIKFYCTANSLGLKKKKKITTLAKLIKFTFSKSNFITNSDKIALHFKNCTERLVSFSLVFLTKYYNVDAIKIKNNKPHNGCRPRKLKRKKRQRLLFS